MTAVSTSIETGSVLRFTWVAPNDRGDSITSYTLEVLADDSTTFMQDSTNCPGTDPSLTYCDIPLSKL